MPAKSKTKTERNLEFKPRKKVKFEAIRYEKDKEQGQIAYITLNRPDKNNAISIGRGYMTQ